MHRFRLAVATRCWNLPLRDSLRASAATGATGVQFDLRQELNPAELTETARRDLLHLLSELGLTTATAVFPLKHPLHASVELERRIAALKSAMTTAANLKIRQVCLRAGRLPAPDDAVANQTFREVLWTLASHGNHVGTVLCLTAGHEPVGPLAEVITSVTSGPLALDLDPAAVAMAGDSSTQILREHYQLVGHVQLRDGLRDLGGTGEETAVGEGTVDWVELLSLLSETAYSGWLTAIRTTGDDRGTDLARAIQRIQRLLLGG